MSPSCEKSRCRQALQRRLRQLTDAAEQAAATRHHLRSVLAAQPPQLIAAFAAIPGEIDLRPLVADSPHRWVFPRIDGSALRFLLVEQPGDFESDAYHIDAPRPSRPQVELAEITRFLIPGLGFTRSGQRLGRGKGFYDRALAQARLEAWRIGVAYREQVIANLPVEAHDVPLTHLLTADGLHATPAH